MSYFPKSLTSIEINFNQEKVPRSNSMSMKDNNYVNRISDQVMECVDVIDTKKKFC